MSAYAPVRIAFNLASGALLVFGWYWVAATFTMTQPAWWTSVWAFIAIFAGGTAIGSESRRGLPWLAQGLLWIFPILNGLSMAGFLLLVLDR
jgi:hypothetical protein